MVFIFSSEFPGEIQHSPLVGNCLVAKRLIHPGERICLDLPITTSPNGPENKIPICLSCYKSISDINATCNQCKCPLCSTDACQNNPNHEPICNVLAKQSVQFDGTLNAYLALEVLNGLLLRDNIHMKDQWAKILSFESHRKERNGTQAGRQITEYVLNFIRACKIGIEDDEDLIDHVLGAFAINTYWKHGPDVNVSVLSSIGSLLTHSCDPNTKWDILFLENPGSATATAHLCVEATKTIEIGQLITTTYLSRSLGQEVKVRREKLKNVFYFDCQCELCLEELELEKIQ